MNIIIINFPESVSIDEKLRALAEEVLVPGDGTFTLRLRRAHVLTDALDYLDLASESELFKPLRISFIGEQAVDEGGPRREFASLLLTHAATELMNGNCYSTSPPPQLILWLNMS